MFKSLFGDGFYLRYIGTNDNYVWEIVEPDKDQWNVEVRKGTVLLTIKNGHIGTLICGYNSKRVFECLSDYLFFSRVVDVLSLEELQGNNESKTCDILTFSEWVHRCYKRGLFKNKGYREISKGDIALKVVDILSFEELRDTWANAEVNKTMNKQFTVDDWANGVIDNFLEDRLHELVTSTEYYHWCIFYKGKFAGAIWFRGNETKTVGGLIKQTKWGKGIMTKAMKLALKVIKKDGVTKEVIASYKVDNERSAHVLKNCGFKQTDFDGSIYTERLCIE